ncbi:uncharacterized protein BDZ99DRAFT_478216 [Mytilinidion resinicola]|uniref:Uncharacterized protein n=1 Tax=Mytilinidion resinicola TaxID=574789 RepID=A0A6A6YIC0_9PEZI|nr:uncharacterized protein BDZ99DRAFT_478216 [Mytilinidion resinicola]KAF2807667.1 hypothetical protein BDZ99DRAFT_478216 [Mytilinidion resinicola]
MFASALQLSHPPPPSRRPTHSTHLHQTTEQPHLRTMAGDEMSETSVETPGSRMAGGRLEMPVLTHAEFEALRKDIVELSKFHVQEALAEMDAARREEIQNFRNKLEEIQSAVNENTKMVASFLSTLNDMERRWRTRPLGVHENQDSSMAARPRMHGDMYRPRTPPYVANDSGYAYETFSNRYISPSTSRETSELSDYPSSSAASGNAIECSPAGFRDYMQAIQALREHDPRQADFDDLPESSPTTPKAPGSRRPMRPPVVTKRPPVVTKRPVTTDDAPELKRRRVFPAQKAAHVAPTANPLHPLSFMNLLSKPPNAYPKPNEYKLFPGNVTYVMQKDNLVVVSFPEKVPQGLEAAIKGVIGELEARRPGWRSAPGLFTAWPCIFNYGHGGGSTWTREGRYRYACRSCSSQGRPCIKMAKHEEDEDLIEVTAFSLHPTLRKGFSRAQLDYWVYDSEYVFNYDCFKNALK